DGIDLHHRQELRDLDQLRGRLGEGLDLLVREGDVLILRELVAPDGLLAGHDLAVLRADVLLLEARAALAMQHVEGDRGLTLGRVEEADRYRDEPEGNGSRRQRTSAHTIIDISPSAP